ncbi:putative death-on-curing family protein [Aromatoleum aromaticum EbN1]|uniref:Death-on-curing family protein n=1 Tax=Aromatoleum aromaticum (strain DSM 19018 / LMG 30748 / EbN1) TaxID=76114 RepID=Q5P373_AROAE|nr:virulence protein RhuM/Fic/DOC family protein [Aromatoleum aromaticum]CAI08241.1 putative death-on-curing family protein [Aromatoleum aromaticum EbN1]
MNELVFFEAEGESIQVRIEQETVWLSQEQIARLFERDRSVITKHLRNVFREGELDEAAVCANFARTASDGKTYQTRFFNLDAILSVGYRVNSRRGTQFRQWASRVLKDYLTRGYALDRQRLEHNARELEAALQLVRRTLAHPELGQEAGRGLAEIVVRYTQTFLWLQRYDEGLLTEPRGHPGGELPSVTEARAGISNLKTDLMAKGQASALFGIEREDGLAALLGNLDQTAFGEPAYPTLESRAAHLLYFIVKNHPFTDGNKRIGAFLFAGFLHRNGRLFDTDGSPVINDVGLAALSLLVAQSRPDDRDVLIRLLMNMLAGNGA